MLLYSLCNWLVLFFSLTVPTAMSLVPLVQHKVKSALAWSCCLLLYISALAVCTSVSSSWTLISCLWCVLCVKDGTANFHCVLCVYTMHCISSKRELLLIITFVCIYLIAAVLVMTAAQQFSVLLLLLVTRQQPCEPIKLLDFCTWFSDWLTHYDHCCTLKPVYGDGGHTYGHYPFTSFPGSVLKKWGGESLW